MRATFSGLEIGRTGLIAGQKGLDLTGHNIANVDTAGYTRQRMVTSAYEPYSGSGKFVPVDKALVGAGVDIRYIDQLRSSFFDRQFRTENSLYAQWSTRTTGLTYIESLFEDTDDSAISEGINDLFQSFMTLTNEANDKEQRTVIQQAGISLTDSFNQIYDRLIELQDNENTAVEAIVGKINTIANNIANLNKSIYRYELSGQKANDLRDQRNLLLDELSGLVDIDYHETAEGELVIRVAGEELVNHTTVREMVTVTAIDPITGKNVSRPAWDMGGGTFDIITAGELGGELKAHMDLRDNSGSDTPGITYFVSQLNTLAQAIVNEVNQIHRAGYTHPASGSASTNGVNFFEEPASGVTAGNIKLSAEVLSSVYNIAASDTAITGTGAGQQQGNQENARSLYEIINMTNIPGIGGINSFMSGIILDVAITLQHSKTNSKNQQIDMLAVDNQRTSISGVSLDEEMTNLIKYQHAYNGASRVITAMDEALEVIINRMGVVGR